MIIQMDDIQKLLSKGSRDDFLEVTKEYNKIKTPTLTEFEKYLKKQREEENHRHLLDEASKLQF